MNSSPRNDDFNVDSLVKTLEKTATQICAYLDQPEIDAIGDELKVYSDDPRLHDLRLVKIILTILAAEFNADL